MGKLLSENDVKIYNQIVDYIETNDAIGDLYICYYVEGYLDGLINNKTITSDQAFCIMSELIRNKIY